MSKAFSFIAVLGYWTAYKYQYSLECKSCLGWIWTNLWDHVIELEGLIFFTSLTDKQAYLLYAYNYVHTQICTKEYNAFWFGICCFLLGFLMLGTPLSKSAIFSSLEITKIPQIKKGWSILAYMSFFMHWEDTMNTRERIERNT